jgi:hypothetical protein
MNGDTGIAYAASRFFLMCRQPPAGTDDRQSATPAVVPTTGGAVHSSLCTTTWRRMNWVAPYSAKPVTTRHPTKRNMIGPFFRCPHARPHEMGVRPIQTGQTLSWMDGMRLTPQILTDVAVFCGAERSIEGARNCRRGSRSIWSMSTRSCSGTGVRDDDLEAHKPSWSRVCRSRPRSGCV